MRNNLSRYSKESLKCFRTRRFHLLKFFRNITKKMKLLESFRDIKEVPLLISISIKILLRRIGRNT